ncbi:DUF1080 domain-containing protein [Prolixibacter sp. NT017]|uniref:3-keto-disaccharide hydrolase n=1 Tax=Prolixibacter sp. NT017 TaxID=2652390 RepID=UPI001272BC45|nr:DUF1080 domain-containing protein [Prolixibacter sp. NT017]GET27712.1 hypothetical protein NT017_40410 [Prolixibacter sp. NT017]
MTKIFLIFVLIAGCFTQAEAQSNAGWRSLFNGKNLKGWETYVGPLEKGGTPLGIKKDPMKIFSVVKEDGQPAIRISGEVNASLATRNSYENYHLHLEFKWGKLVFSQRNSGLLYHSYGPFGTALDVWMNSHELQMKHGDLGDLYCMGDTYNKIPAVKNGDQYIYQAGEARVAFGNDEVAKICSKSADYEKPLGEWNTIDLYCFGSTSVHVINGKVNMVSYDSRKWVNKELLPLVQGKIQLQSEGGELFIRNIRLKHIKELPSDF